MCCISCDRIAGDNLHALVWQRRQAARHSRRCGVCRKSQTARHSLALGAGSCRGKGMFGTRFNPHTSLQIGIPGSKCRLGFWGLHSTRATLELYWGMINIEEGKRCGEVAVLQHFSGRDVLSTNPSPARSPLPCGRNGGNPISGTLGKYLRFLCLVELVSWTWICGDAPGCLELSVSVRSESGAMSTAFSGSSPDCDKKKENKGRGCSDQC